jgi:hypothetical protein
MSMHARRREYMTLRRLASPIQAGYSQGSYLFRIGNCPQQWYTHEVARGVARYSHLTGVSACAMFSAHRHSDATGEVQRFPYPFHPLPYLVCLPVINRVREIFQRYN